MSIVGNVFTCRVALSVNPFDNSGFSLSGTCQSGATRYFNGTSTTRCFLSSTGAPTTFVRIMRPLAVDATSRTLFVGGSPTAFTVNTPSNLYSLPYDSSQTTTSFQISYESDGSFSTCPESSSIVPSTCSYTGKDATYTFNTQMICPIVVAGTADGCHVKVTLNRQYAGSISYYMGYAASGTPTIIDVPLGVLPLNSNSYNLNMSGSHLPRGLANESASYIWTTSCGVTLSGCPMASYVADGSMVSCTFSQPLSVGCSVFVQIVRHGLVSNNATLGMVYSSPLAPPVSAPEAAPQAPPAASPISAPGTAAPVAPPTVSATPPTYQPSVAPLVAPPVDVPTFSPHNGPSFAPSNSSPVSSPANEPTVASPIIGQAPTAAPKAPEPVASPVTSPESTATRSLLVGMSSPFTSQQQQNFLDSTANYSHVDINSIALSGNGTVSSVPKRSNLYYQAVVSFIGTVAAQRFDALFAVNPAAAATGLLLVAAANDPSLINVITSVVPLLPPSPLIAPQYAPL
jgi:hypothetical protein